MHLSPRLALNLSLAELGLGASVAEPASGGSRAEHSSTGVARIFRRQVGHVGLIMSVTGLLAQPLAGYLSGAPFWTIAAVVAVSSVLVGLNALAQVARGWPVLRTCVIALSYFVVTLGLIYLNHGIDTTWLDPLLWIYSFVGITGLSGSWLLIGLTSACFYATLLGGKLFAPDLLFGPGANQDWMRVVAMSVWWSVALLTSGYCGRRLVRVVHMAMRGEDDLRQAIARENAANAVASGVEELRRAHCVARIGTWRHNLQNDTIAASPELLQLMALDISSPTAMRASFLKLVMKEDQATLFEALTRALGGEAAVETEWRAERTDGELAWFWGELSAERDVAGRTIALRGVCQDITEHRTHAERIYQLAHYDPLTGLANRTLLGRRAEEAVGAPKRRGFAVLCLDLDGFKAVNDVHGHSAGDRLLQEVSARLQRNVRDGDTVARLGGDEFVILQVNGDQPGAARGLADRLVRLLAEPYELGAGEVQLGVTASIGVCIYPDDGQTAEELLRKADTALYRAKAAGKNLYAFFRPEMDRELRERRAIENDLRAALARDEFRLAWQPLSDVANHNEITGFEVLLRWHHPARGVVPPDDFIPIAESCGIINTIGAWVLRGACAEAASWPRKLRVAVNASPLQVQLGTGFASIVANVLRETGLEPDRLVLEVTEGVLIREPERVLTALREVKALGVRVALDDFGTGYSSLATLRAFPFDRIKIDRSFVAGLARADGAQDAAIVRAVLGLAGGLGLPVTAEGVENAAQMQTLTALGCDELQGWLIGRPAPIETFAALTGAALTGAALTGAALTGAADKPPERAGQAALGRGSC